MNIPLYFCTIKAKTKQNLNYLSVYFVFWSGSGSETNDAGFVVTQIHNTAQMFYCGAGDSCQAVGCEHSGPA